MYRMVVSSCFLLVFCCCATTGTDNFVLPNLVLDNPTRIRKEKMQTLIWELQKEKKTPRELRFTNCAFENGSMAEVLRSINPSSLVFSRCEFSDQILSELQESSHLSTLRFDNVDFSHVTGNFAPSSSRLSLQFKNCKQPLRLLKNAELMSGVQTLEIDSCELDPVPDLIAPAPKLNVLILRNLGHIRSYLHALICKSLVHDLSIVDDKLSDDELGFLCESSGISRLNLSSCKVNGKFLKCLQGQKAVKSLNLEGTAVTDEYLPIIAGLPGLTDLNIKNTKCTVTGFFNSDLHRRFDVWNDFSADAILAHLEGETPEFKEKILDRRRTPIPFRGTLLDLSSSGLSKLGVSALAKINPSDEELFLDDNPMIDDKAIAVLRPMEQLKGLSVCRCPVTGIGLQNLAKLRSFAVSAKYLTSDGLVAIASHPGPLALTIAGAGNTLLDFSDLKESARVDRVEFRGNLSCAQLSHITSITALRSIIFKGATIDANLLDSLEKGKQVKSIELIDCQGLQAEAVKKLSRLTYLQRLNIYNTDIDDASFNFLVKRMGKTEVLSRSPYWMH